MTLSEWINAIQEDLGISTVELVQKTRISHATIYRLKNGGDEFKPRKQTIKALEDYFQESYKPLERIMMRLESTEKESTTADRAFHKQGSLCVVCDSKLPSCESAYEFLINIDTEKKLDFNQYLSSEEEEELTVFTCKKCASHFDAACNYDYQTIVSLITAKEGQHLTVDVSESKAQESVIKKITNQTLLAKKLNIEQSTISRIVNKKIQWLDPYIARSLHTLCAKRLEKAEMTDVPFQNKRIAMHDLIKRYREQYNYPDSHIKENFRQVFYDNNILTCDILLQDHEGENSCAIFIVNNENHAERKQYYLGVGLALNVEYVCVYSIQQIKLNLDFNPVFYLIVESDTRISTNIVSGIPPYQLHPISNGY